MNISISQHYICTCSELPIVNLFVLMLPSSNAHLFNVQLCFMVYIHCKNLQLILVKNLSIYMYTFHYYFCFILVPSNLVVYIGVLCVKSLFCLWLYRWTIPLVNDLFMHSFSGVGLFILCYKELSLFSFLFILVF